MEKTLPLDLSDPSAISAQDTQPIALSQLEGPLRTTDEGDKRPSGLLRLSC